MNNLIDRMITRVQRPISTVEPLLTQLYVSHANVSANDEINSIPVIKPRRENRSHLVGDRPNISGLQIQRNQDVLGAQTLHQPAQQQPRDVSRDSHPSDSLISKIPAPILAPYKEPSLSSPSQFNERDDTRTQLSRPTQSSSEYIPDVAEKEPQLPRTRLAAPQSWDNDHAKRTERRADGSNVQNQLEPPTTEVNISIGHIEVRAIQRIEPIHRSAPPSHVTLDDYLRRRPEASR